MESWGIQLSLRVTGGKDQVTQKLCKAGTSIITCNKRHDVPWLPRFFNHQGILKESINCHLQLIIIYSESPDANEPPYTSPELSAHSLTSRAPGTLETRKVSDWQGRGRSIGGRQIQKTVPVSVGKGEINVWSFWEEKKEGNGLNLLPSTGDCQVNPGQVGRVPRLQVPLPNRGVPLAPLVTVPSWIIYFTGTLGTGNLERKSLNSP